MATEWWKLSPDELAKDEEAREAKRLAYFRTFYGDDYGMEVLFDLTNECFSPLNHYDAVETVALIRLLGTIKENCGFNADSQMAAIEAESKAI